MSLNSPGLFITATMFFLVFFSGKLVPDDPVTLAIGTKALDFRLPGTDGKIFPWQALPRQILLMNKYL